MRQHPIPQNVLDVEFKLFTKFTLKEFAYLAAGLLGGGLFLLLNHQVGLPGIIAWPAFIALSGIGAFFALVPINDQNADEFVKNYFTAINKPTQRVWLNDQMKENRTKPIINTDVSPNKKIIGGSGPDAQQDFTEKPGDDIFESDTQETRADIQQDQSVEQQQPVSSHNSNTQNSLVIGPQNLAQYQFQIQSVDKLPGNINIWLADSNNRGLVNIPTFLKDKDGKVIFANRTGPNGYFLTNQIFPPDVYYIQFEQDIYQIPSVQLVLNGNESKNPIKITAKLNK
jgi:hypothetical protein